MKKIWHRIKRIWHTTVDIFMLLLGGDCKIRQDAVDIGLCDFSGQGRDKYGK